MHDDNYRIDVILHTNRCRKITLYDTISYSHIRHFRVEKHTRTLYIRAGLSYLYELILL